MGSELLAAIKATGVTGPVAELLVKISEDVKAAHQGAIAQLTKERDELRKELEVHREYSAKHDVAEHEAFMRGRSVEREYMRHDIEAETASAIALHVNEHYVGRDDDPHNLAADIEAAIKAGAWKTTTGKGEQRPFARPWPCPRCEVAAGVDCKHIAGAGMAGAPQRPVHLAPAPLASTTAGREEGGE